MWNGASVPTSYRCCEAPEENQQGHLVDITISRWNKRGKILWLFWHCARWNKTRKKGKSVLCIPFVYAAALRCDVLHMAGSGTPLGTSLGDSGSTRQSTAARFSLWNVLSSFAVPRMKHASHGLISELFSSCLLLFSVRGFRGPLWLRHVRCATAVAKSEASNSTNDWNWSKDEELWIKIEIKDTFQSSHSTSFHKTQQQSTSILMQVFERVCGSRWPLSAAYEPWVGWVKLY